jgi:hypothetical protein
MTDAAELRTFRSYAEQERLAGVALEEARKRSVLAGDALAILYASGMGITLGTLIHASLASLSGRWKVERIELDSRPIRYPYKLADPTPRNVALVCVRILKDGTTGKTRYPFKLTEVVPEGGDSDDTPKDA